MERQGGREEQRGGGRWEGGSQGGSFIKCFTLLVKFKK